jgi:amino acid transporter
MSKSMGLFGVIMLIVAAIDSIRNLPATALFGSSLIFFFIFSAIVFLMPTALVSAELAARHPEKGGIYYWVKSVFGHRAAFLSVWLQWINTMIWYPTILSFIAATAVYFLDPKLAQNKIYLVTVILSTFWLLTYVNIKGIKVSAAFNSFCGVIGTVIPMLLIIGLGIVWLILGKPLQIHFGIKELLPTIGHSESWISLTAIMTAFLGMELTAVHVNHIKNAQKTYPKAVLLSAFIVLVTMMFGALAIAFVLPAKTLNLLDGVLQAFSAFLGAYHLSALVPVITVLILVGSFGGIINWVISPAKGLLQAAEDGYLPPFLRNHNAVLILQAILVSIICLAFLLMPSVNGSYWLLSDLSTQLYLLMYVMMFIAAIATKYKFKNQKPAFEIPGGLSGMWLVCLLGLAGCAITFVVGFFPPAGINVGGFWHYETVFTLGIVAMIFPVIFFYKYQSAVTQCGQTLSGT